ncbi:MAG: hypothetical protein C4B59_10475 [Candidatus Methanogaster sp.]|uniref:Uncharacterized protein n=1 Tax=Candidatus Methanogaster sp. TaxID=3386292 RepID=A0AC61L1A6_9EURY|nr:MAG: hypothetical protein C4B59_10475 [ANME-2 cluster archaeon]
MRCIEFHDREKETKEIRAIPDSRPTLITSVYGPISGKTELIDHVTSELPDVQAQGDSGLVTSNLWGKRS